MAVMHGSRGVLRFSRQGGPVWYQPSDRNLTQPIQSCDVDGTLIHRLAAQSDSVKVKEALWAAGTCVRNLGSNFEIIKPENMCYRNYEHSIVDRLGDTVPLVFDVPLTPGGSGEPRLVSPPGGPPLVDRIPVTSSFEALPTPHFHVTVPPTAFPTTPSTITFEAVWGTTPPPATRRFSVEVKVLPGKRHDNMSTGDVEGFFIEAGLWLAGISDISCTSDDDDELVVYASVNNRTLRIPNSNTTGPILVDLRADETLTISTGGFECDLSCGERWDDEFTEAPNDRIGTTKMAFTGPSFGASPTLTYRLASQADLTTPRSRELSRRDYSVEVTIREQ
jgi:hypothetical protein